MQESPSIDDVVNARAGTPEALIRDLGLLVRHLLARSNRGVFAALDELDLPFSQTKIVMSFMGRPEPRSLGAIAEESGLSLPAVSRAVDALCKRGLVTRSEDPSDRRTKLVQPSERGDVVIRRLSELRVAGIQDFVASLSAEERAGFETALAPIVAREEIAAFKTPRTPKEPTRA